MTSFVWAIYSNLVLQQKQQYVAKDVSLLMDFAAVLNPLNTPGQSRRKKGASLERMVKLIGPSGPIWSSNTGKWNFVLVSVSQFVSFDDFFDQPL